MRRGPRLAPSPCAGLSSPRCGGAAHVLLEETRAVAVSSENAFPAVSTPSRERDVKQLGAFVGFVVVGFFLVWFGLVFWVCLVFVF